MLTKKEIARRYYLRHSEKLKVYSSKWRKDNPEKVKEKNKIYYEENREKEKIRARQWQKLNPEKAKELHRNWKKNNPKKVKDQAKRWHKINRERMKEVNRQWRKDNSEYLVKYRAEHQPLWQRRQNIRRKTDLRCNLNHRMSAAIRTCLKSGKDGRHWEDLVGYTLRILIKHLKKTIPKGYAWQDFLNGKLHLDHKIPISAFNFSKPEHIDFKKCWALSNLQLLPAKENLIKSDKLSEPFQPAFKM